MLPASAQIDTEGWAHAQALEARFKADDRDGFLELFRGKPELSRRAFMAAMELGLKDLHNGNDNAGGEKFLICAATAYALEKEYQDPIPGFIMKAFETYDDTAITQFLNYADKHYPGYREALKSEIEWLGAGSEEPKKESSTPPPSDSDFSKIKHDPKIIPTDYFAVVRPYLVKIQRISFAGIFDDQSLVLQELESFQQVEQDVASAARKAGAEARLQTDFAYLEPEIELAHLRLLAEMGLLEEFDSEVPSHLSGSGDKAGKLSLLYTAYRVAMRTQAFSKAESYLNQMATLLARGENSPVFAFAHRTGQFQLELARGRTVTPTELNQEFSKTWGLLGAYQPSTRVSEDVHWHFVRDATRFWLNELTELEAAENVDAIVRINEDCGKWLDQASAWEKTLDTLDDNEILFYSPQLQGYLTVVLSNLDIVMYIFETWKPMLDDRENFADVVEPFPKLLEDIAGSASQMNPQIDEGPGFPPFELSKAFLLTELRARSRYLLAIDPGATQAKRVEYLEQASEFVDLIEQPESFIDYQLLIGKSFSAAGQPNQAIDAWTKAHVMAQDRRFVRRALEAASYLAEEYGKQKNWSKAKEIASAASKQIEEELDATTGPELAAINSTLADILTQAALEENNPEAALVALTQNQQVQAATLRLRGDSKGAKETAKLTAKKKKLALLSRRVKELESRPSSATRDELLKKTEKLLAESRSEFLLQSRKIRKQFSKLYSTALRFDPLNLPDVQGVLPPESAVVQYFPTENDLYIFVVTRDKFRLRSVSQRKVLLDRQILSYARRMTLVSKGDRRLDKLSQDLYATLIAPIKDDVADSKTLVLIPAGKLNLLPFASLKSAPDKYLIDEKVLLELAKPTDFLKIATRQPKPVGQVVAFANATLDLPAAEAEGEQIAKLFPSTKLFKGTEASKSNLLKFGGQADVLHLATHGTWDAEDSLRNHLKLSNDERLAQEEIFELSLEDTSIVTLSACSTALGEHEDVEYVASLAEAFWIAGSRSVVASLWQVDDTSTGLLMSNFYQGLKDGTPKGEALRNAQLAVRKDPRFQHPYFWSGFLLFGDYR